MGEKDNIYPGKVFIRPNEEPTESTLVLTGFGDPRFYEKLKRNAELHSKKNQDYAKDSAQGHLGNFKRVSAIQQLYPGFNWTTPFGVAMSYMLKQLDAAFILYGTKRHSVTSEDVNTRLRDVGVYAPIGEILWEEEEQQVTRASEVIPPHKKISLEEACPICQYPHACIK